MEKTAVFEHEVMKEIRNRKSGRAYLEKAVEEEKIHSILEAARWAPSSANEQPWKYIVAKKENTELYHKVFGALNESNQVWVQKAPIIIVSMARKTFMKNGTPNKFALHDTGAANTLLALESAAVGLMAHQMGGYDADKLRKALNVPDDIELASVITVGYAANPDELPENLRTRELAPRERYTQHEFVSTKAFE